MNMEQLVCDALHEQAADTTTAPPDFAGRVFAVRRRRRTRTIAAAAVATTVAVAVAVAVPVMDRGKDEPRLASQMNQSDIIAHPDQAPPRDLIAAGNTALAAYYTFGTAKETKDRGVSRRTYHLLDQETGKYVKTTKWSFLDVAPGMRTAAVLEKDLLAKRIGLLDLLTGEVVRWIPVDRGVASVRFSPDGSKLVATTYDENPDLQYLADYDRDGDGKKNDWTQRFGQSSRTGFYILDVESGKGSWSKAAGDAENLNVRQDFVFSHDGKLVYSALSMEPHAQYYDFEGNKVAKPAKEKYLHWSVEAGLSPDGKLAAGDFEGSTKTTASAINDPYTGKRLYKIPGQQLLAWVDNKRLIAFDIAPGTNEFHNRLVLVTIGSDKTVPLSGFRKGNDGAPGRWTPIFAER
ncbi:WD40 repeat domain-containing protein [Streptomyces sp. NBC_00878]|uniref:WD40 repeat domain-containing protein n=1 Tax=Streptomyces sp. NBC_00878 TaxID=2975854 RepID=UPI002251A761|nr:WD40 repeat domain-containing protein [Streptomyces sp. NBC_00878]MCX4909704.1 WD40 repeat domain-containing protein [Streptomyces sp. NBC_00878]